MATYEIVETESAVYELVFTEAPTAELTGHTFVPFEDPGTILVDGNVVITDDSNIIKDS